MKVELVEGVEGYCLCVNDIRIAGPKPWGGGKVVKTWCLTERQVYELLDLCNKQIEKIRLAEPKEGR